jgi:hypothetical protein
MSNLKRVIPSKKTRRSRLNFLKKKEAGAPTKLPDKLDVYALHLLIYGARPGLPFPPVVDSSIARLGDLSSFLFISNKGNQKEIRETKKK